MADEWHSLSDDDWSPDELAEVVVGLLTPNVTQSLPPAWQGDYSLERAARWVQERDAESTVLLLIGKSTGEPVGMLILFESPPAVRIGYLLSENTWGRGLGSELVSGFVDWCGYNGSISRILAGVDRDNPASTRVLEKCGFHLVDREGGSGSGEHLYEKNIF